MPVVDTNVVLRFLVRDHPEQTTRATATMGAGDVLVPLTVTLEVEWVLRRSYRFSASSIAEAFRRVGALAGVALEAADRVARALDLMEAGMDFADALHLAVTPPGVAFRTFDRDLIRRGAAQGFDAREP